MIRGWVAIYTLGLPATLRDRRRNEIAGDLADETHDAVRRGELAGLRARRLVRWALGIPDDLAWRLADAPAAARLARTGSPKQGAPWVPLSRWSLAGFALVVIVSAGALLLVLLPTLSGQLTTEVWPGWGAAGFIIGCAMVLLGILAAIPWPRRGAAIVAVALVIGLPAAPWLWGCWFLAAVVVAVRAYEAREGTAGGAR